MQLNILNNLKIAIALTVATIALIVLVAVSL